MRGGGVCVITLPAWSWPVSCLPLPWEKLEGQTVSLPSPSVTFFFSFFTNYYFGGEEVGPVSTNPAPPIPSPLACRRIV